MSSMPIIKISLGHAVNGVVVDVSAPNGKTLGRFYATERVIRPEAYQIGAAAAHAVYLSEHLGARIQVELTGDDKALCEYKVQRAAVRQCVSVVGLLVKEI